MNSHMYRFDGDIRARYVKFDIQTYVQVLCEILFASQPLET